MFGYRFSYIIFRPWIIIKEVWWALKFAWQRVFRGWDDRASWDVSNYLAKYLPEILRMMRDNKIGIPMSCYSDADIIMKEKNGEMIFAGWKEGADERAEERWEHAVDSIIMAMEAAQRTNENMQMREQDKIIFDNGMMQLSRHFFDLWD